MFGSRVFVLAGILLLAAQTGRGNDALIVRAGRHIELTSDIMDASEIESLVTSFDAAVPQWFDFWKLPAEDHEQWRVRAFVMRHPERFRNAGLIPHGIPDFPHGYASGNTVWVVEQSSEYYTRHLLLHEGVHALAFDQFGGAGASWFMEGTAELLATHRGEGRTTEIDVVPQSRKEVPYWGRFKIIGARREESAVPTIESIMRLPKRLSGDPESYGWSWAAAMLLYRYPEYRDAFYAAAHNGRDSSTSFTRQLYLRLKPQWPVLVARWRLMCHDLDYGFDWQRERVALSVNDPLWDGRELRLEVKADQGWQSSSVRIPAGASLTVSAEGRAVIAETTEPWISEPSGVTVRYHRGRPLGQLLVCTLPCRSASQPLSPPLEVTGWEDATDMNIAEMSWLLFRVNDEVGELAENQGGYQITVTLNGPAN